MKMLWIVASLLILGGCGNGGVSSNSVVGAPQGQCAGGNPANGFCGTDPGFTGLEPTAVMFGDSINLGIGAETRHDLCGVVDFRHNSWDNDGISMCGKFYSSYAVAQFVNHGINDGCAETQLPAMQAQFANGHRFNVVAFTAGLHDFQVGTKNHTCGNSTPEEFRAAVEKLAEQAEAHADVVIWVDTPPVIFQTDDSIPAGIQNVINPIGDDIAREHGFYIAEMPIDPSYHMHNDVHFIRQGYQIMGEWLAACVVTALNQQETSLCHH